MQYLREGQRRLNKTNSAMSADALKSSNRRHAPKGPRNTASVPPKMNDLFQSNPSPPIEVERELTQHLSDVEREIKQMVI